MEIVAVVEHASEGAEPGEAHADASGVGCGVEASVPGIFLGLEEGAEGADGLGHGAGACCEGGKEGKNQ